MPPYFLDTNKSMRKQLRDIIALTVLVSFIGSSFQAPVYAQLAFESQMPWMPKPGVRLNLSPDFTPAELKGITIHPENPLMFDFIIHRGDKFLNNEEKKVEYKKLIKYFLASLAIPDEDQWVNLSPYEKDRIIKDDFGKTLMGRDLLSQDYILKQITASLIYPEEDLGKKFWNKVYAKAQQQYGTTNIPVNTFNKVWIIPDDALIYEKGNTAYVLKNHLKVMLEEDYLSLQKHSGITSVIPAKAGIQNNINTLGSQVVREIVLPALEREVNTAKNFALLRQVYSGMLLAAWFKRTLKQSILGQIYADKTKIKGIDQNPQNNEAIYQRYLRAYKKGVFNYIKEDIDKYTNEAIPRKYFSGGLVDGYDPDISARVLGHPAMKEIRNLPPRDSGMLEDGITYEDVALVAMGETTPDVAMINEAEAEGQVNQFLSTPGNVHLKDLINNSEKRLKIKEIVVELLRELSGIGVDDKIFGTDHKKRELIGPYTMSLNGGKEVNLIYMMQDPQIVSEFFEEIVINRALNPTRLRPNIGDMLIKEALAARFRKPVQPTVEVQSADEEPLFAVVGRVNPDVGLRKIEGRVMQGGRKIGGVPVSVSKFYDPEDFSGGSTKITSKWGESLIQYQITTGSYIHPVSVASWIKYEYEKNLKFAGGEEPAVVFQNAVNTVRQTLKADQIIDKSENLIDKDIQVTFLRIGKDDEIGEINGRYIGHDQDTLTIAVKGQVESFKLYSNGTANMFLGAKVLGTASGVKALVRLADNNPEPEEDLMWVRKSYEKRIPNSDIFIRVNKAHETLGGAETRVLTDIKIFRSRDSVSFEVQRKLTEDLETTIERVSEVLGAPVAAEREDPVDLINRLDVLLSDEALTITIDGRFTMSIASLVLAMQAFGVPNAWRNNTPSFGHKIQPVAAREIAPDKTPLGGIDLNAANLNMQIKRDGRGVVLPLAKQDLAQLSNIAGLEPDILSIIPASQTPLLSQLQASP